MTPDDLEALALQADIVRHMSWEVSASYEGEDFHDYGEHPARHLMQGGNVQARVEYDSLPEEVRGLCAAVPALIDKVRRLEMVIAQAILAGA